MKIGACGILLLAILGSCSTIAELVLESGGREELETIQEDPGTRKIGFGQALGYHTNNKINSIKAANQAAKKKLIEDWRKLFSKHFGGNSKRSIHSFAKKSSSSQTQKAYSQKWANEFGKVFGGQKLTEGDFFVGGSASRRVAPAGGKRQGDARRPNSKLLKQWNKAYEKYFGKKKNKFYKQWSKKYNSLFG